MNLRNVFKASSGRAKNFIKRDYNRIIKKKRIIGRLLFEVCSSCQNNCKLCVHEGVRSKYNDYQLSIEELKDFIYYTENSHYYIEYLYIHGAGEPTLWEHFNEGIKLLHDSSSINNIYVVSNGLSLDRIHDTTWKYIQALHVSLYPSFDKYELLKSLQRKYGDKITVNITKEFKELPIKGYENTIPCECGCYGPMFIKDMIFLFCGPPLFNAAELKGVDIFGFPELYTRIGLNYLAEFSKNKIGNLDFCKYCFANTNIKTTYRPHIAN